MTESSEKAGKIVSEVRSEAVKIIKDGLPIIELINFVENSIIEKGGFPAFPCNVSINEIAAHYTSPPGDTSTIKAGDLVKLDLGAHVDGYIGDSAISVLVDGYEDLDDYPIERAEENLELIQAASDGLDAAISTVRAGVSLGEIGANVEDAITNHGFRPVANLTGHSLTQWNLHAGLSVPSVRDRSEHILEEGDVIAIEPFATNGIGYVTDMPQTYIFKYLRERPLRMAHAKKVLRTIKTEFKTLPFAQRWLLNDYDANRLHASMRLLAQHMIVYPYNVLREKENGIVAQKEHTVRVESDGCTILTK